MKKVLTALMAMVMVLSIGVNAFAVTDVSDWRNMDSYKKLENDHKEIVKLYSEFEESKGDPYTYISSSLMYLGDGLCKHVLRMEAKGHTYRMTEVHDLVADEKISFYIIRDDGLRYTEDELIDYLVR